MKTFLKKLASFIVIVLFVSTVFAVVTYAENGEFNSIINNSTVINSIIDSSNISNSNIVNSSINNSNISNSNIGNSNNLDDTTNSTHENTTIPVNSITSTNDTTTSTNDTCIADNNSSVVANGIDNITGLVTNNTYSDNGTVANNITNSSDYGLQIIKITPPDTNVNESITVINNWSYPVDLKGWTLHEEICGNEVVVPSDIMIQPGETKTILVKEDLGFPRHQMFHWHDSGYFYYKSNVLKF